MRSCNIEASTKQLQQVKQVKLISCKFDNDLEGVQLESVFF
jgi:hypothetical protein